MKISFHGAAKMVTGSCHHVDTGTHKFLFDCGIFQGSDEIDRLNYEAFKFDPADLDYVFLSHAHLDHCGRLPRLVKHGFNGRIITTQATRDLARVILLDAASLQSEDFARAERKNLSPEELDQHKPLYTEEDVERTISLMDTYNYGDSVKLSQDLEFRFRDAGHILGSAITEVWVQNEQGATRKIVFTGDIGHRGQRIVKDPDLVSEADYVIVESTYGNRTHKSRDETVLEFLSVIKAAQNDNGNVIIPTFAVERAQEIIYELNLFKRNKLLENLSVYLDSPMAIKATEIFKRYSNVYDEDATRLLDLGDAPLEFQGLHYTSSVEESKRLNMANDAVIMAGSGMATGGRVVHHLRHNLPRNSAHVLFVGFQVPGTLGRNIIDNEGSVKIFGEEVQVKAKIHTLGGFSAHADQFDLIYWLRGLGGRPQKTFIVHGDPEVMSEFSSKIVSETKQEVYIPELHEEVEID